MKLTLDNGDARFVIDQYAGGQARIAGQWYAAPLIIRAETLLHPWAAPALEALSANDFADIQDSINVLLLGTGPKQQFPDLRLLADLAGLGIGLEVMDNAAACRTYNVLVSEGRAVAAALYLSN